MSADPVQAAADELYGLLPDEFTTRRDAIAKKTRADGDTETAKAIKALRRPAAPAWLVNLLVRRHGDDIDGLLALGEQLREAQSALDGSRMKQLSAERTVLIGTLSRQAGALAASKAQKFSGAVERDVEETLRAAVVDPRAADAVATGRLTRALTYAGLGEVDVSQATATPPKKQASSKKAASQRSSGSQKTSAPERKARDEPESANARKDAARRAAAERKAVEAVEQLEAAAERVTSAQKARQAAEAMVADLQQQVATARQELAAATKAHDKAKRTEQRTERSATAAHRALEDLLG
ncbi:MAG: hypothetical protein H0V69_12360 [Acidimicrobiia bacterium]|nr:hypothetical protein [Acidimicrobiia bacterium]